MKRTYVKNLTPEELHEDTSEGFILSQLNHPHIVKLYESFFENDYFYVIVEYCEVSLKKYYLIFFSYFISIYRVEIYQNF